MKNKLLALLFMLLFLIPVTVYADDELYLGGDSIGIELDYDGIMISGTYSFKIDDETYDPSNTIYEKDIIKQINGIQVHSLDDLYFILNQFQKPVNNIPIKIERNEQLIDVDLITVYDSIDHTFKSGLYVKDKITGVGTMTYYDPSNHTYGALGHEIMDNDIKEIAEIDSGSIYPAFVTSIHKAQNSIPGEKYATLQMDQKYASVSMNTSIGIYGTYDDLTREMTAMSWAKREEITIGKAYIYTVLEGNTIERFSINIKKLNKQNKSDIKGIEFEVDDPILLSKTNGIIQGMSGSPIVQNGQIIGAITHVVTTRPMNGYGVYIEWMLENSRQ